jgi:hypothetical protein
MHTSTQAHVDQDSPSKLPILHPGNLTPTIMRKFEDCCIGYFEQKDIEGMNQVKKILAGLRDPRVKAWLSTERDHLMTLSFGKFMEEFRKAYLDEDWEETTRRELSNMSQGQSSFWDFAVRVKQLHRPSLVAHQMKSDNDVTSYVFWPTGENLNVQLAIHWTTPQLL